VFLSVWPGGRRLRPTSGCYVVAALNDTLRPGVRLLIPASVRPHQGNRYVDLRCSTPLLSTSPGLLGAQRPQGQLVQFSRTDRTAAGMDVTAHPERLGLSAQRPTGRHRDVRTRPGLSQAQRAWVGNGFCVHCARQAGGNRGSVSLDGWTIYPGPPNSARLAIRGVWDVPCTRVCRLALGVQTVLGPLRIRQPFNSSSMSDVD
jgi:hypothetical protein